MNTGYASDNYSQSTIIAIDVKNKAIDKAFTEIGKNSEVSIAEGTTDTDTVVVVGFGKQKKTDLVGSVTSARITDLKKISSSNVTAMLAGNVAGLISYQRSGEPGADDAGLFIRGVTTFGYIGNGEPLILIDGVEAFKTDLARMQPDDIESISVMKDAVSTAVYGTRGANGVISVTTKEGKTGRINISARFENAFNMPTKNIEFADPITYMRLGNEAVLTRDPLGELPYSQFKIQGTLDKVDKYLFPATDWRKELMKNYVTMPRVNLNIRGGKNELRYYLSGTFNQDNGILKNNKRNYFNNNIKLKTWSFRANVNLSMTKTTEAALKISGTFDDYIGPVNGGANLYRQIMHASPILFPPYYVSDKEIYKHEILFGNYGNAEYINPYAETFRGVENYSQSKIDGQFELKQDFSFLTEGLSLKALFNGSRYKYSDESRFYDPRYYTLDDTYTLVPLHSGGPASYRNSGETKFTSVYVQLMADYHRTFAGKHTFSGMVTYLMNKDVIKHEWNSDFSLTRKTMGLSGRVTYSYRGKYSGEFNFGYSGSECDHRDYHFGFFPSAGLAWTISNEDFWNVPAVSNLKLKASYGLAGNDAICCDFRRAGYVWETDPNDLSGEIARKTNVGFELGLFGRLNLEADFFHEHRTNILMPLASGLAWTDAGEAKSRGIDGSLDYTNNLGKDLHIRTWANFTYAASEVLVFEEPDYEGHSIHQQWGLIAEKLFSDDVEAANSPVQFGSYGAGDIKYRDMNSDGSITTADMAPIGYPTLPEIIYGFGISAGYKNFDVSCFFQGSARSSFWINAAATSPFDRGTNLLKAYADSHWSENNRDIYAMWPRLSPGISENNVPGAYYDSSGDLQWGVKHTWFMRNGSFLRLKSLEIGYTLPSKILKAIYLSNVRLYINGINLFCFSNFKLWDVEMAGEGLGYPIQRSYNAGITVAF